MWSYIIVNSEPKAQAKAVKEIDTLLIAAEVDRYQRTNRNAECKTLMYSTYTCYHFFLLMKMLLLLDNYSNLVNNNNNISCVRCVVFSDHWSYIL